MALARLVLIRVPLSFKATTHRPKPARARHGEQGCLGSRYGQGRVGESGTSVWLMATLLYYWVLDRPGGEDNVHTVKGNKLLPGLWVDLCPLGPILDPCVVL